jgi:hypothetical protein
VINLIFVFSTLAATHAGSHEKRLLHHLLDGYNVLERPVMNESDPLQLSFGLTLMQIIDVVSIALPSYSVNIINVERALVASAIV